MSRFVRPETVRLELSEGDWLLVKRRLTAGESRRAFTRTVKRMEIGSKPELDPEGLGLALIVQYLIDWSFTDDDGVVVPIRDQPPELVEATLLLLDHDSFREIDRVVRDHDVRQGEAMAEEKKTRSGVTASSATSTSVG